ncbi:conserved hypothethical protein [Ralstonia solanacearum PSI07]|nr:conserved hypothethical protein [Ralstonia solanacearum PSI07]
MLSYLVQSALVLSGDSPNFIVASLQLLLRMKLYENIVIGNFLYGLGFAIRAQCPTGVTPSVVNLLQQTPADMLLGDLLLRFPGVVRLIEFKARGNRSPKEQTRHAVLSAALKAVPYLEAVSRRVHWFIETAPAGDEGVVARVVPYLDAFPADDNCGRLEPYIEALAHEVAQGMSTEDEAAAVEYLRWVSLTQGAGTVGSGGLLLLADATGALRYAQLHDMQELRIEHRAWIEMHQRRWERAMEYGREKEQERQLERQPKLERSGPSLSM